MNHNSIVRILQILTHILLIAGLFIQPFLILYSILIYWVIGVLGINIGYHRLISHRSFETWKPVEYFLALVGIITTVGSPLAWSALHRQHHQHAERWLDGAVWGGEGQGQRQALQEVDLCQHRGA